MQIICISRGTYAGGSQLAEKLAAKLGFEALGREQLTDAATMAGIPVGQLEMAILRRRPLSEQMALHKERFRAWVTASLCERALKNGIVYHGRNGHLQLPGVPHILRVRAIMDLERRIELTTQRLGLSHDKARQYVEQVDEDRYRWARTIYSLDWDDPANYDVLLNLSHLSSDNAAAAMVPMVQLPEFQPTPASQRALEDLYLAARCRLAVGDDERTRHMDVKVRAEKGSVLVTYLPRDQERASEIAPVLDDIAGVEEVVCTMASTSLLWIQESFATAQRHLPQVLEIAGRWNAAVELVRFQEEPQNVEVEQRAVRGVAAGKEDDDGGILDEEASSGEVSSDDANVNETIGKLISAGRAGGFHLVRGSTKELVASVDRTALYNLAIVGDVFLDKGEAVRKRRSRELISYLADNLRIPVIGSEELGARFLFGPKQWVKLFASGLLTALLFALVYSHQPEVLAFLRLEGTLNAVLRAAALFAFIPLFAFAYGNFTQFLLRLLRFE